MSDFLQSIGAAIGPAVDFLASDGQLRVPGSPSPDGQGGWIEGAATVHPVRLIVSDYSDFLRSQDSGAFGAKDRRVIVLASSLPSGVVPAVDQELVAEGVTWRALRVVRDPAGATYEIQARPA